MSSSATLRGCWLGSLRIRAEKKNWEKHTLGTRRAIFRSSAHMEATMSLGSGVVQQCLKIFNRCRVCLFWSWLRTPLIVCVCFPSSDRDSRFKTKEDCGNRDPDVLHAWNNPPPWDCLLYAQLAGHPARHLTAQLPLPPLLLVIWFWSSLHWSCCTWTNAKPMQKWVLKWRFPNSPDCCG